MPWIRDIPAHEITSQPMTVDFPIQAAEKSLDYKVGTGVDTDTAGKTVVSPCSSVCITRMIGILQGDHVHSPGASPAMHYRQPDQNAVALLVEVAEEEPSGKQQSGIQQAKEIGTLFSPETLYRREDWSMDSFEGQIEPITVDYVPNDADEEEFYKSICMMPFVQLTEQAPESWNLDESAHLTTDIEQSGIDEDEFYRIICAMPFAEQTEDSPESWILRESVHFDR
jgi:hypothetical protein